MAKYKCENCGYIYDERMGDFDNNVGIDTKWTEINEEYVCPVCQTNKEKFRRVEELDRLKCSEETDYNITREDNEVEDSGDVHGFI